MRNGPQDVEARAGTLAVSKVFTLLNAFTATQPWWSLTELAAACGMPASTASRLLGALQRAGAVQRDPVTQRYSVGPAVLPWAGVAQRATGGYVPARHELAELVAFSGETAALYLRQGLMRVCLDVVASPQAVQRAIPLGEIAPLAAGAAGRMIAAYLDEADQLAAGTRRDDLERLRQARAVGLACSYQDRMQDAWAVAGPIMDRHGDVGCAVVITGPVTRYRPTLFDELAPVVRAAALTASRRSGAPAEALRVFDTPLGQLIVFGLDPPA